MAGTTSLTISNELLSATMFDQIEELNQTKDHPYLLVDDAMANTDRRPSPGERTIVRYETGEHSIATRVRTGHEGFVDYAEPILTPGHETWGIVVQPVFISRIDEERNTGEHEIVNIWKSRVDNVYRAMRRSAQTVWLRGAAASSGAGTHPGVNGWDDFLSLNGDDTATGIIEAQTSGTNTLHNISKGTFPATTHPLLHNTWQSCSDDASANLLNAMYATGIALEIKWGQPKIGDAIWYVSELGANFFKQSLRSFEQYVSDGEMDDGQRKVTMYGGRKMRFVSELPNNGDETTGVPWTAVLVDWKNGVRLRCKTGWVFEWDPVESVQLTVGTRYALCKFWGQLIGQHPGRCALVTDGEVF